MNNVEIPMSFNTGDTKQCCHCGLIHLFSGICPRIKEIEYFPNGTIKRVEYIKWSYSDG